MRIWLGLMCLLCRPPPAWVMGRAWGGMWLCLSAEKPLLQEQSRGRITGCFLSGALGEERALGKII